ncbi:MAG TPA: EAL domain-containing protein, partial [Nevskiaceae bacterium]|nr:EAL domain-containing protein [Nevskiaceae bacterium]
WPGLPVVLLSGVHSFEKAAAAMALGAHDLVGQEDQHQLRHLELVVKREFAHSHALRELNQTRTRLTDFESRHKQLLDGTNDAVAHIQEGILSHVNPAFAQMLGYEHPEDLLSLPLMDIIGTEHVGKVKEHLKLLNKGKVDDKPLECALKKAGGGNVPISAKLTRGTVDGENFIEMLIRAEAPPAAAAPAPAAPVTMPAAAPAPAATPAQAASGRMAFVNALATGVQGSQKMVPGALFLAVDDYAGVEERLGFRDAEEAVIKLTDWVKQKLTPTDQLFRFSTGELAALVVRATVAEVEQIANLLAKQAPEQVFATQGHEAHLSLTVICYPLSGGENPVAVVNDIVREARKASKAGGKQHVVMGPTAKSSAAERDEARRATQIKRAIEDNRLKLAYQSIASLEGDTRQHFDVLLRMVDETGKEMHAGEFIGAAEKFGLMRTIDRWVTLRALKILSKRESGQEASSLFVKISEETLKDAEGFIGWMAEVIKQRPLKPEELVFQFQETRLQSHIGKAKLISKALASQGAAICIEHFGVGTSTPQLLEHVPASFVKFHPSFTQQFNDKETQRKMTQLMELAKLKNIKTIVSHVEDANVMARLWQMGVNYIQGFHIQEPEVVLLATDLFSR